jgi:hypothetical protein
MASLGVCLPSSSVEVAECPTKQAATKLAIPTRRLKGGGRQNCLPHQIVADNEELRYLIDITSSLSSFNTPLTLA